MSVRAEFVDGVFRPLDPVVDETPGKVYRVFSDEELSSLNETLAWLKSAETSFQFWDNPADAAYDNL